MDLLHQGIQLFYKGGLVMIPLLACSLFVAAIAVERYSYYRRQNGNVAGLLSAILPAVSGGDWEQALAFCRTSGGCAAAVALAALETRSRDIIVLEKAMEGAASLAAAKLRDRLQYLEFVVTLSPLLGLLGTVVGMIQSFNVMNLREGQPFAITGGVGEALVATATGLCVAIFALVVHAYFARQLDRLVTDMEETGYRLLKGIRGDGE